MYYIQQIYIVINAVRNVVVERKNVERYGILFTYNSPNYSHIHYV